MGRHRRRRPVAEGRGVSMAQVALAWLADRPAVTSVILGARTIDQLDDNLGAADLHLTPRRPPAGRRQRPAGRRLPLRPARHRPARPARSPAAADPSLVPLPSLSPPADQGKPGASGTAPRSWAGKTAARDGFGAVVLRGCRRAPTDRPARRPAGRGRLRAARAALTRGGVQPSRAPWRRRGRSLRVRGSARSLRSPPAGRRSRWRRARSSPPVPSRSGCPCDASPAAADAGVVRGGGHDLPRAVPAGLAARRPRARPAASGGVSNDEVVALYDPATSTPAGSAPRSRVRRGEPCRTPPRRCWCDGRPARC